MNEKYPTIVYCATKSQYLKEAEISAQSIRNIYGNNIEIILHTSDLNYHHNLFNEIRFLEKIRMDYSDKQLAIINTDRDKILFLDADTYVIEPIDELFVLLDRFDIALAHAPNRWRADLKDIPKSFPEFNTGVILMKKTDQMKSLLQNWFNLYIQQMESGFRPDSGDQVPLRELLYKSDCRIATLTPEYNCRFNYGVMGSYTVKILHGRSDDLERVAREVNTGSINSIGEIRSRWIKYPEKFHTNV